MSDKKINHLDTDRLIVKFKDINIGADIAKGTSLVDALRAIVRTEEKREARKIAEEDAKIPLVINRHRESIWDSCCNKEDRDWNGGCIKCGDPCL